MYSEIAYINMYHKFQQSVVEQWHPASKEPSAIIIPPVSLRDEIKTDGYGMAIIEILCLSGILTQVSRKDDACAWVLNKDWEAKTLYICMDGLSLDRRRSFQKKLVSSPFSYHKSFEQSLIFQKSLSRVVEISGPLHIAFHMLQSIFVVYKDMIKWCQRVLDVKKINVNKVSDSFDTYRRHCYLILEELERLNIDLFIESTPPSVFSDKYKAIDVVILYNTFIKNRDTTDDRRLYMFGFYLQSSVLTSFFLKFNVTNIIIQNVHDQPNSS